MAGSKTGMRVGDRRIEASSGKRLRLTKRKHETSQHSSCIVKRAARKNYRLAFVVYLTQ